MDGKWVENGKKEEEEVLLKYFSRDVNWKEIPSQPDLHGCRRREGFHINNMLGVQVEMNDR